MWVIRLWFSLLLSKSSDSLEKIHHVFDSFHCFPPFYDQERIAPVTFSLTKNEWFERKTKERISNPACNYCVSCNYGDISTIVLFASIITNFAKNTGKYCKAQNHIYELLFLFVVWQPIIVLTIILTTITTVLYCTVRTKMAITSNKKTKWHVMSTLLYSVY